jgi:hypothetical protein
MSTYGFRVYREGCRKMYARLANDSRPEGQPELTYPTAKTGLPAKEPRGGRWAIGEDGERGLALANESLGDFADRNYSPRTVRGCAFDLPLFAQDLVVCERCHDDLHAGHITRPMAETIS